MGVNAPAMTRLIFPASPRRSGLCLDRALGELGHVLSHVLARVDGLLGAVFFVLAMCVCGLSCLGKLF